MKIKIKRTGGGTDTQYQLIHKGQAVIGSEVQKAIAEFPDWKQFYRPLAPAEQREIVNSAGGNASEDDE